MKDSEKFQQCIDSTITQLAATNQMLTGVNQQSQHAINAGKKHEFERLAMHLDLKSTLLLSVVASYEAAKQQAIANERATESRITLVH